MYFPASVKELKLNNFKEEQAPFNTKSGGMIHFVKDFKYLGSWISQDLYEDKDIDKRIQAAQYCLYDLRRVFRQKYLSLKKKKGIYETHVLPTLLFGCESWTLSANEKRKLEVFHHRAI